MHHWKEKFNLKVGHPPNETAQVDLFKKAIDHSFTRFEDVNEDSYVYRFLNYGEKKGDYGLRNAISKWVTNDTKYQVNPDNLFVTNGCSQGLDMLFLALCKNGDNILIEGPSYYLNITTCRDHKLNVYTVMKDEITGELDLEKVEQIIKEKNIKAFYVIATVHNPTSLNLPLHQRNALYNLGKKYQCYMLVDDVYEKFIYDQSIPRLAPLFYCSDEVVSQKEKHGKEIIEYDNNANHWIISLNSFNKLINPGFRIGWIMAEKSIIQKLENLGYVTSGGGVNSTLNQFVRSFIELGYIDIAIETTQKNFSNRIVKCDEVLKNSEAFSYIYPQGGYFFWLALNDKVNIDKLKAKLEQEDFVVLFGDGAVDATTLDKKDLEFLKRRVRLCFTRYELNRVLEGFALFRKLAEESMEQ